MKLRRALRLSLRQIGQQRRETTSTTGATHKRACVRECVCEHSHNHIISRGRVLPVLPVVLVVYKGNTGIKRSDCRSAHRSFLEWAK